VVGVVELGGVVVGGVVVEEVELGATVVVVAAPLVVVGAAVVVLVSAPATETGRTESPRRVAAAATARAPTRARDVLRTGRELARIVMSSKVRDGPTSPLSGANL
jgi:flagellar motor component MotA